jgi:hypothetical protein
MKFSTVDLQKLGFELSEEFGEDNFEDPEVKRVGVYGAYELVGHGRITSPYCGQFVKFKGCLNVHLHNKITLEGVNYADKIFVRKVRFSCGKPSCPICYKRGWAVREAGNIEARLNEAHKRYGLVEHIVVSVPTRSYGLSLKALRAEAIKALKVRKVIGGVLVYHAFRYNRRKCWYFSPHFHVLGFLLGGYGCRGCVKGCEGCSGFEGRTRRAFKKDGYIVKVLPKRITVKGTAWYQLSHATVKKGVRFFRCATWFGVCSYRKLHFKPERHVEVCPICQHDLIGIRYFGGKVFNKDGDSSDYERDSFEDYKEGGRVVWFERVKRSWYSSVEHEED